MSAATPDSKMAITFSIGVKVKCPDNMGYPAISAVQLHLGEYGGEEGQVNLANAISPDRSVLKGSLRLAGEVATGLEPTAQIEFKADTSVELKPSYFLIVIARQVLPDEKVNYYAWHSIVYDLKLDPESGVINVEIRPPAEIVADGFAALDASEGTVSNNLTGSFTRLANRAGGKTQFVAGCAAAVWDANAAGYSRASNEPSIGACADKCRTEADCQLFNFDSVAATNNCMRYMTGINKLALSVAAQADASTKAQCWSKNTMLKATTENNCTTLGAEYGFTDAGCRKKASGGVDQVEYCKRVSEGACNLTTGCAWKGRGCNATPAVCDVGFFKDATSDQCIPCAMGQTTTAPGGACVDCATLSEASCPVTTRTANQQGYCRLTGSACTNPASNNQCESYYNQDAVMNKCSVQVLTSGEFCGHKGDHLVACGKRCGSLSYANWKNNERYGETWYQCGKVPSGWWVNEAGQSHYPNGKCGYNRNTNGDCINGVSNVKASGHNGCILVKCK